MRMSDTATTAFSGKTFESLWETAFVDGVVTIFLGGLKVHSFAEADPTGRDLVVCALRTVGLTCRAVARLCGVSTGHVAGVKRRVEMGGLSALAARGTPGRQRAIAGAELRRVAKLHKAGCSLGEIAAQIGQPKSTVASAVDRLDAAATAAEADQVVSGATDTHQAGPRETRPDDDAPDLTWSETDDEDLVAGEAIPNGPAEHDSRYAGSVLLCAAVGVIGLAEALVKSDLRRPQKSRYTALHALQAWMAAWAYGMGSLEAMHERDAAALGVLLGLERSPSVRTLHRAIGQMTAAYNPIVWSGELTRGIARAFGIRPIQVFGVDGHTKPYKGDAPIDKGWDTKRRIAVKALGEVRVSDTQGVTWSTREVGAGDALSEHLVEAARSMRSALRDMDAAEQPIILAFDRGGFCFNVFDALDRDGVHYVAYVPASVSLPELRDIAPASDGVGEVEWAHAKLGHHSRLLVERDGSTCIPIATNLPTLVDAATAVQLLRDARGWQENGIKAARAFAHIDRLVDRGGATYAPDDRLVPNPSRAVQRAAHQRALDEIERLAKLRPIRGQTTLAHIEGLELLAELHAAVEEKKLGEMPERVARLTLTPMAQRAWLKTKHRMLLGPLKHTTDNARRWLLSVLGPALAPTDHEYDASARSRTLVAVLQAPGTIRFDEDQVTVTLELNLPPTAHRRIAAALEALDDHRLQFTDGLRHVVFRAAPRATRADLAHNR